MKKDPISLNLSLLLGNIQFWCKKLISLFHVCYWVAHCFDAEKKQFHWFQTFYWTANNFVIRHSTHTSINTVSLSRFGWEFIFESNVVLFVPLLILDDRSFAVHAYPICFCPYIQQIQPHKLMSPSSRPLFYKSYKDHSRYNPWHAFKEWSSTKL